MIFDLPTSVEFGGRRWDIATDYRDVLRVLLAFEDPDLTDREKMALCLYNLIVDYEDIPRERLGEAYDAIIAFIDHGSRDAHRGPRTMDWEQDGPLIFPAVNRVAGFEVRSVAYMHWWTFMGLFMEIREDTFATVISLRQKRARGKKLEKWEAEYWTSNKAICELGKRLTEDERDERDRLNQLMG